MKNGFQEGDTIRIGVFMKQDGFMTIIKLANGGHVPYCYFVKVKLQNVVCICLFCFIDIFNNILVYKLFGC